MNNKDEMKKIYLAIPYSQIDRVSSFIQANEATALLLNKGYNVFSPISHCHVIASTNELPKTWDFWKEIDLQFVDWADEVWIVIPTEGMDSVLASTGVMAEMNYAKLHNKKVQFIKVKNSKIIKM